MPCRDGGPSYSDDDDDDEDIEISEDEYTAAELIEAVGIGQILIALAGMDEFEPLRMPPEFRDAMQPWIDEMVARRDLPTDNVDIAATAACDALGVIEEFGLASEVQHSTLEWWGNHKEYDAKRKAILMENVKQIRNRRRLRVTKTHRKD